MARELSKAVTDFVAQAMQELLAEVDGAHLRAEKIQFKNDEIIADNVPLFSKESMRGASVLLNRAKAERAAQ